MDIVFWEKFLLCNLLINVAIFFLSFFMILIMGNFAIKMHKKIFKVEEKHIRRAIYSFFGWYKLVIIVFMLVPWLVLLKM